jgi:hypothetical protein
MSHLSPLRLASSWRGSDDIGFDKAAVMANLKSFGVAGTVSYVVTELVFWALALPGGHCPYHQRIKKQN